MIVGWVSHQWPQPDDAPARPGLLPGRYAGGAEMLQDAMRSRVPAGASIRCVDTRDRSRTLSERLEGCDAVVVAGLELLTPTDVEVLAGWRPLVWLMSPPQPWQNPLLDAASPLVWASRDMERHYGFSGGEECSGWFDLADVPRPGPKQPFALWAGRDHPQKGKVEARMWARQAGLELVELTGRPRSEVLAAMAEASHFVLLAKQVFDPCPTTVIEAEIAGCEIVTNRLVGRTPVRGSEENVAYIEECARRFWSWL